MFRALSHCVKVLFDHSVPAPLGQMLRPHKVTLVSELGWLNLDNDDLVRKAEAVGFDVLISSDPTIRDQQALAAQRRISLLVTLDHSWPALRLRVREIVSVLEMLRLGDLREVCAVF